MKRLKPLRLLPLAFGEVKVVTSEIPKALIYQGLFFRCPRFTSYINEVNMKLPNDSVLSLNFRDSTWVYPLAHKPNVLNLRRNFVNVSQFYCALQRNVDLLQKFH